MDVLSNQPVQEVTGNAAPAFGSEGYYGRTLETARDHPGFTGLFIVMQRILQTNLPNMNGGGH